jgi:ketosteroid isomerase-like protein
MRNPVVSLSLLIVLCAVGCRRPEPVVATPRAEVRPEAVLDDRMLRRDLEATVLENYQQLSLDNIEAYGEAIARNREVTLIGVSAREVVAGVNLRRAGRGRSLYRALRPTIYSKNLEVHLSRDASVGWVFDEVSYRVPYLGRVASIPIRVTAVYVRDIDRWVLAMEHLSYAVPDDEVLALAVNGGLRAPRALPSAAPSAGLGQLLARVVTQVHHGERGERRLSAAEDALVLFPDPGREHHGDAIREAKTLASVYGAGGKVELLERRIALSPGGSVAWMAANLRVRTTFNDEPLAIGLRATYVLENRGSLGWEVVQMHVSVPMEREELDRRVFGEVLAPEPERPDRREPGGRERPGSPRR